MKLRQKNASLHATDFVLLSLSILILLLLFSDIPPQGKGLPATQPLSEFVIYASLLFSFILLLNTVQQTCCALREATKTHEDPSGLRKAGRVRERRFEWKGPTGKRVSRFLEVIEKRFHRFYAFHRFHPPCLVFYYYAKKNGASLFAVPWIKTGFFLLFAYAILMKMNYTDPAAAGWVTGGTALFFWLPGILLYTFFPYRKFWLCLAEGNGKCYVTITCFVPSRPKQADRFCASLKKVLIKDLNQGPSIHRFPLHC